MTAGDTIADFAGNGAGDRINIGAAVVGTAVNTTVGAAATFNFATQGLGIINASLDVTGATTAANVAAALNAATGFGGGFSGGFGSSAFFTVLDGNGAGAGDDEYNIFEVVIIQNPHNVARALSTTDQISRVATVSASALIAGDFIL